MKKRLLSLLGITTLLSTIIFSFGSNSIISEKVEADSTPAYGVTQDVIFNFDCSVDRGKDVPINSITDETGNYTIVFNGGLGRDTKITGKFDTYRIKLESTVYLETKLPGKFCQISVSGVGALVTIKFNAGNKIMSDYTTAANAGSKTAGAKSSNTLTSNSFLNEDVDYCYCSFYGLTAFKFSQIKITYLPTIEATGINIASAPDTVYDDNPQTYSVTAGLTGGQALYNKTINWSSDSDAISFEKSSTLAGESNKITVNDVDSDSTATIYAKNYDNQIVASKQIQILNSKTSNIKSIANKPNKLRYVDGDTFDATGLTAVVTYTSGIDYTFSYADSSSRFTFFNSDNSPLSTMALGTTSIKVSFDGCDKFSFDGFEVISKDAAAVETFIANNLNPSIPTTDHSETSFCKDNWSTIKNNFTALTVDQKNVLKNDYNAYFLRLQAYAIANHEIINDSFEFIASNNINAFESETANSLVIILSTSIVIIGALIGFYVTFKKHKISE